MESRAPTLITDAFERTVQAHADRPAMRFKRGGEWRTITWRAYHDSVRRAARALIRLGVAPGQCVTIIGFNRPEWFIADLAAIHAGAIPVGLYPTSSAEQCEYIAGHCEARVAIVENEAQLAKFLGARARLPQLEAIVLMEGASPERDVLDWSSFMRLADDVVESTVASRVAAQRPEDVCTIIYTSGTTGSPKGVMLTHDNITWTAYAGAEAVGIGTDEQMLSYLPLSHIAEQITTMFGSVTCGMCISFAESMERLGDNLREVRPTVFLGVPRVWEKIQERMQAAGAAAPPFRRRIVRWARSVGMAGGIAEQEGRAKPLLYPLAQRLVFSKVRKALGLDRARLLVTSAAPISRDTLDFFLSLGLPIMEVYGMSECTGPATVSTPDRYRTGKAGVCFPGTEMRIAEEGEICMRGRHVFRGYFKDRAGTAEALDADGWLHSGDIGRFDENGFLEITDRKKDLIITAGGENIAPQYVEGHLKSIPVVSQAVVVGDRRRHLAVLLTLDPEKIPNVAREAGCDARDIPSALRDDRFLAYLQQQIDGVNRRLSHVQTVKRFAVVPNEFTVEGGELTPSMKVRRNVILEKYRDHIERLYS